MRFTDAAGIHNSSEKCFEIEINPFWPLPRKLRNVGNSNQIYLPRIGDGASIEGSLNCARRLKSGAIDFELVKAWIQQCGSWHEGCRNLEWPGAPNRTAGLRVLDVERQCLTQAVENCRYVALSYVWGNAHVIRLREHNLELLTCEGALQTLGIPRTIQDAITVVQHIGERYLWVDSLCLMQDSPSDRKMLADMDAIYSHAVLTIVAADGVDADAGIPGVQPDSRHLDQVITEIKPGLHLSISMCPTDCHIELSPWSSRSWTYQERLMSRRMLIFLREQVLWHCSAEKWTESRFLEHPRRTRWRGPPHRFKHSDVCFDHLSAIHNVRKPVFGRRLTRTGGLEMYLCTVEVYTARCLTFEKDVLDAFAGLGRSHETAMESRMIWGLPERFFDMAMLWFRGETFLKRRICGTKTPQSSGINDNCQPFPSWSWAGWVGPIMCSASDLPDRNRDPQEEHIRSIVKWYRLIRTGEDSSSLLAKGFNVPFSPTNTFERITQAHEDPNNKHEVTQEEINISSERNTERYQFDLPLQTGRHSDSDTGETAIDDVPPVLEDVIAMMASEMYRSRLNNGNVSERTIIFKGLHWVYSINEKGIISIAPPEEHGQCFGKDLPMAPPYQSVDTSVYDEYLPGDRTDFAPGEEHRETFDLLSRLVTKRDFRYLYFKSSTTFFRIRPYKYEPSEAESKYSIGEEYP